MTAFGLVTPLIFAGTRVVASRTEKCWAASVSLKTIGALGPPGLDMARGAHDASAAAPARPAAPPRNRRRSMRSSSAFTASSPHCPRLFTGTARAGDGGRVVHGRPGRALHLIHLLLITPKRVFDP